MSDQNLFVLIAIQDNALVGHWSFQVPDELAVARQLLRHVWSYKKVFWGLRIHPEEAERLTPEELLCAIHASYSRPRNRAVLHLVPVAPPAEYSAADTVATSSQRAPRPHLPADGTSQPVSVVT
jgi:hypothetical protein